MDHSGIKTGENERTYTVRVFIQHHTAAQLHTAIPKLARVPLGLRLLVQIATVFGKSRPCKSS